MTVLGSRSRRAPSLLAAVRVLAWGAGYGAAFVVAYDYAGLPDVLPLSRWTSAPKSMFFAVRVPLIHLAGIGLCELVARCASRVPAEHRLAAERAAAALLSTAGVKAWLAAKDIVGLPEPDPANRVAAFVVVVAGLLLTAWYARPLLDAQGVRALRSTRLERVLGMCLVALIVLLNLPLVAPGLFQ